MATEHAGLGHWWQERPVDPYESSADPRDEDRIRSACRDAYDEGRSDERTDVERELAALLPGSYYMDPPDGGDVPIMEQLRRMAKDAELGRRTREHTAAANACILRIEG